MAPKMNREKAQPLIEQTHFTKYDGYDEGKCPNCHTHISNENDKDIKYCKNCGQKLDIG